MIFEVKYHWFLLKKSHLNVKSHLKTKNELSIVGNTAKCLKKLKKHIKKPLLIPLNKRKSMCKKLVPRFCNVIPCLYPLIPRILNFIPRKSHVIPRFSHLRPVFYIFTQFPMNPHSKKVLPNFFHSPITQLKDIEH
jgi:hypothetical protein